MFQHHQPSAMPTGMRIAMNFAQMASPIRIDDDSG
jgi:hypothetical protein